MQMHVYEGSLESPQVVVQLRAWAQEGGFEQGVSPPHTVCACLAACVNVLQRVAHRVQSSMLHTDTPSARAANVICGC